MIFRDFLRYTNIFLKRLAIGKEKLAPMLFQRAFEWLKIKAANLKNVDRSEQTRTKFWGFFKMSRQNTIF